MHAIAWMNLKDMLSERKKTQKITDYDSTYKKF